MVYDEFVARMLCIVGLIVLPVAKRMVSPSILIAISRYTCS